MKNLNRFLMSLLLVAAVTACGDDNNNTDNINSEKSDSAELGEKERTYMKVDTLIPNVTVYGTLLNGANATLVLEASTQAGPVKISEVITDKEGSFNLVGNIDDMGVYQLRLVEQLQQGQDQKVIPLTLEKNDSVNVEIDFNNYNRSPKYAGARWTDGLNTYMKQLNDFIVWQESLVNPGEMGEEKLMSLLLKEKKKMDDFAVRFIQNDPGNPANLILMNNLTPVMGYEYWDKKYLPVLTKMKDSYLELYPENPITEMVTGQVEQIEIDYKEYVDFTIEKKAPEIEFNDPSGKKRKLSDLRGKYVLIDFWASWCAPCRVENPNVVKVYNKYKNKGFDIFSVSLDTDAERWKKAIDADGLVWENHVSDLLGWKTSVVKSYNFQGIPHTVLLDPDGKIIATNLRGPALENKLKEVIK